MKLTRMDINSYVGNFEESLLKAVRVTAGHKETKTKTSLKSRKQNRSYLARKVFACEIPKVNCSEQLW